MQCMYMGRGEAKKFPFRLRGVLEEIASILGGKKVTLKKGDFANLSPILPSHK